MKREKEKLKKRKARNNELKVFIIESKERVNPRKLSMALNLILSEKDVMDYLESETLSFLPLQKEIEPKKEKLLKF